jgi:hypothetical protein
MGSPTAGPDHGGTGSSAGPDAHRAWFAADRVQVAHTVRVLVQPSREEFADCVRRREPVVLRGAFAQQPAVATWSPEYLATQVGDTSWEILVSRNGQFPGGTWENVDKDLYRATERPLAESLLRVSGKAVLPPVAWDGERAYLYQVPLHLLGNAAAEVRPPSYVPYDPRSGRAFVWVGQAGNITPTHVDLEENLLVQVAGSKDVLLWDAAQYPYHYLHPVGTRHEFHSQVDVTDPDLQRWPAFARARALLARLGPGDALYLPFDHLHCVHSSTPAISVNFWWGRNWAYRAPRLLSSPMSRYFRQTPVALLGWILRQPELGRVRRLLRWPKPVTYRD